MYTAIWLAADVLFVICVILHLAARRSIQMLSYRNDLDAAQAAALRKRWETRIRIYKWLWILLLAAMIAAIVRSVTGRG